MHVLYMCAYTFLKMQKAWVPENISYCAETQADLFYEPGYKHVKFLPSIRFKGKVVK